MCLTLLLHLAAIMSHQPSATAVINPRITLLFYAHLLRLGVKKRPDVLVLEQQICWILKANQGFSTMASSKKVSPNESDNRK